MTIFGQVNLVWTSNFDHLLVCGQVIKFDNSTHLILSTMIWAAIVDPSQTLVWMSVELCECSQAEATSHLSMHGWKFQDYSCFQDFVVNCSYLKYRQSFLPMIGKSGFQGSSILGLSPMSMQISLSWYREDVKHLQIQYNLSTTATFGNILKMSIVERLLCIVQLHYEKSENWLL